MSELQAKKCDIMDRLSESLQGKIDWRSPKAIESIERCVDKLTKFLDLPDIVFTTALERFHSHSTHMIFLCLNNENKLHWLYSLASDSTSSSRDEGGLETNSTSESPGTPGTPGRLRRSYGRHVSIGIGSAADACVLDHAVSQDPTFLFPPIGKYYLVDSGFTNYQCFLALYRGTRYHLPEWRGQDMAYLRYLKSVGFLQDLHWTLNVEQRFMWIIMDDNTRAPMRDDALAEAQMGHWARGLRRHFGYPYTFDQPEPHYPSMLEVWGPITLLGVPAEDQCVTQDNESSNSLCSPVREGVDAPIVILDSAAHRYRRTPPSPVGMQWNM
ncbi:UNVERIFIED_CONTAM: hypothetical protein Scaly_1925100 [Sesamum calycinum]|uniref:DDE Tnp4 domain-containing protein n=1 Tax=Sesamum calycinum TaxID=2727403 RepID=A0AAW2NIM9_9LAMI